jgi:hypothetical protein
MEIHGPVLDYVTHFGLEAIGSSIGIYAYNYCQHLWHKLLVWTVLSVFTTIVTVSLVG